MSKLRDLLVLLSDGQTHSGEELGSLLGVSRSAVWQTLNRLLNPALEIHAVRGRGYRLVDGLELLDETKIRDAIQHPKSSELNFEIFEQIPSTNTYLLSRLDQSSGSVCLAEQQTAARGRRGRSWVSPFGKNIALSLLWRFSSSSSALAGLSLVVGIAIIQALEKYGIRDMQLKWPNDLIFHGHKVGGILIEIAGDAEGPCHVVIGIGLNLALPQKASEIIQQPFTDLQTILGKPVQRNILVGLILNELLILIPEFESQGFSAFQSQWMNYDSLFNQKISVESQGDFFEGIAEGVNERGYLLVKKGREKQAFNSGEVSVRLNSRSF